jgi:hypothetical protein
MLSRELAIRLRDAGLRWHPARGDAFVVPGRDLDDHVFVLSDMVVELVDVPGGTSILAFNGTTEWALDRLEAGSAVWVPRARRSCVVSSGTPSSASSACPGRRRPTR